MVQAVIEDATAHHGCKSFGSGQYGKIGNRFDQHHEDVGSTE